MTDFFWTANTNNNNKIKKLDSPDNNADYESSGNILIHIFHNSYTN
jgi:hypothetical protein